MAMNEAPASPLPAAAVEEARQPVPEVIQVAERLRESARAKKVSQEVSSVFQEVAQLPLWEERVRGLPNSFARSALFTSANRSIERENFRRRKIATLRGAEMFYTGEELRQDDGDVFLQIVHLARQQPLGDVVEFSGYALLKDLEWTTSKGSYERLRDSINRLSSTTVIVKTDASSGHPEKGFGGSLVRKFEWNIEADRGTSQRWRIWLEPEIVVLFGREAYTRIDWAQRLQLPPLAKWLHQFYFTHEKPIGYKIETIRTLCGSRIAVLAKFRYKLRESIGLLVKVGFLISYEIDSRTDILHVVRAPRRIAITELIEAKSVKS
ncbi:MAG: plasmid replication initiator TrfA [Candidatus Accumulibacter sp. UW20]|jgi:hypothetical protein